MKTVAAIALALLALTGLLLVAQQTPQKQQPVEEMPTIKVDVDLVSVLFSVRDKRGALVNTMTKDDFQVFEDGKEQQVRQFSKESDLPITIGLLVDVSGSQRNLIDVERRASVQFFRQVLRQKDMAFVISFGSEAELLQDYTNSVNLLSSALNGLKPDSAVGGLHPGPVPTLGQARGTILFDTVYLAANDKLKGEVGRKAMVLITDGIDHGSRVKIREAMDAAHRADAIIYSVEYLDYSAYRGGFGMSSGSGDLRRISEETGGRMYRVDRRNSLDAIYDELQQELRSQYSISYSPANSARDGGFRKLDIRVKGKDLKVQARKGYFATRR
ncbi:MAG: VWA domain-containing protein [Candidatus Solibacter usitatus]|nr:VWA domain-containing protein [Candidatus Solibacter usitatus]